MFKNKNLRINS